MRGLSAFTEDDLWKLERSEAWREKPALVEGLCRILHDVDPAGIWSGMNPAAMTEYLREVEIIVDRLQQVSDEQGLATALEGTFQERFEGQLVFDGWDDLACNIWRLVTGK